MAIQRSLPSSVWTDKSETSRQGLSLPMSMALSVDSRLSPTEHRSLLSAHQDLVRTQKTMCKIC